MQFLSTAYEALKPRLDDDFVDRLNYYYTPSILLIFGVLVSASQWVGDPIECWVPPQFNRAWEEYTENYCFVQSTYYVPLVTQIPPDVYLRDVQKLSYYQWVPFILGLIAICFYAPYLAWWIISSQAGFNIDGLCGEAIENAQKKGEEADAHAKSMALYIREILRNQRDIDHGSCPGSFCLIYLFRNGCFVSVVHVVCKLFYVLNALAQLMFLNKAFGTGMNTTWGFDVFNQLADRKDWEITGNFPRVSFCDFQVKVLGNLHRYTVQCVLIINMINEKIFLFLWCWTMVVFFLSLWNFVYWLSISFNPVERLSYTRKFLGSKIEDETQHRDFTLYYLRQDGVLVMRKIALHAGNIVGAKILRQLYSDFLILAKIAHSSPWQKYHDDDTREMLDEGFREMLPST